MNPPTVRHLAPKVLAVIVDGPLTRDREEAMLALHGWRGVSSASTASGAQGAPGAPGVVGALVRFEGIVRRSEPKQQAGGTQHNLTALEYQTYDPMAQRELLALAISVAEQHGLISLATLHSRGNVAVGEVSFVLIIESAHRAEALAAVSDFIDRLKRDVPIWKRPVWET
jgi:molybdopterin synthase catalytic subunit